MRPLKLRIEGFGAYAEPQEISFDDVELFAITGQTGSGKSTLLDAMTYALYKATPRIGSKGLKDLKHPQADSAKVELTFALGEQTWRVVRVVGKENQNRLEYLLHTDWKTHPASEKGKELDAKLADILGMDYETFTRAILLPQGQFDLFLRGSPRERRETLIKLYGLESLKAMRERVAARLKTLGEQKARLEGELAALSEAEEERISALREEIGGLERSERDLGSQLQSAEQTLRTLEERQKQFVELEALHRRHTTWQSDQKRMAEIADRLLRAEKAERIWPQLEALQAAQNDLAKAQKALGLEQQTLGQLEAQLAALRQGFEPDRLETLKAEQSQVPLLQTKEAQLKRYGGTLKLQHQAPLPFDENRLDALRDAERQFDQLHKLTERHQRVVLASTQLQSEVQASQQTLEALNREIEDLKKAGVEARAEYEQLEQALEQERTRQGIHQYHRHLRVGEPCPLCGHPVKQLPQTTDLPDLAPMEAALKARAQALEDLRTEYKVKQDRRKQLEESLPRLQAQLSTRQQEEAEARAELEAIQAQVRELGSLEKVREERTQRLAALAAEIRAATGGQGVEAYARSLLNQLQTLEAQARQMAELEARLSDTRNKVSSQLEIVRVLQANQARQEAAVQALVQGAGFNDRESVQQARLTPEETKSLQERQKAHEREGVEITSLLGKLQQALSGQVPVTPAQVSEQKNHVAGLKASLDETKKRLGGKKTDLDRLQKQLDRKRQAQKEKAELDKQTDLWEQLAQDLKGDRFQDFLLERYQSGLLSRASELMQSLSQNRYSLHLEEGEYRVLDRWTDSLRPVRTLSGGESFMASLSLALSLSEHLSRGRIGALFLDEGFGTLDAETLEQVAGILEALPTQGRLVGIVTHVEALAERLPARLQVEKSPAGSKVRWRD
ncbi:SMC family ATPase [Meiothermus sp. CFH 77666]|uniref:AAA family ATPase n=1 Tax=Meiothermus sp. CFH 77666 TaxID=2817942 RepID=UPI001AA0AA2F|nr:SMC family ATPase [Meiothermus sp. CFH 77666]MBO1437092.1 SMC family ATPase [Meiothermus sp. CFH 77666]